MYVVHRERAGERERERERGIRRQKETEMKYIFNDYQLLKFAKNKYLEDIIVLLSAKQIV